MSKPGDLIRWLCDKNPEQVLHGVFSEFASKQVAPRLHASHGWHQSRLQAELVLQCYLGECWIMYTVI